MDTVLSVFPLSSPYMHASIPLLHLTAQILMSLQQKSVGYDPYAPAGVEEVDPRRRRGVTSAEAMLKAPGACSRCGEGKYFFQHFCLSVSLFVCLSVCLYVCNNVCM